MIRSSLGIYLVLICAVTALAENSSQGALQAGRAEASLAGNILELHNAVISAKWDTGKGGLRLVRFQDELSRKPIALGEQAFVLVMKDGGLVQASQMRLTGPTKISALKVDANAARLAERFSGRRITVELEDRGGNLHVTWSALLRDESNYIRQEIALQALKKDLEIAEVRLVVAPAAGTRIVGSVRGSPAVNGTDFIAFEHPLSTCSLTDQLLICALKRELPLRQQQQVMYTSVVGVTRLTQLRRDFLYYVERERAHPYRTFLHYNTWYDLGYFGRFDEAGVLDRIHAFGEELARKRGVKLDSFLFDDGWDDPSQLWKFNSGFPKGFTEARIAAVGYGAAPGVWLSPWGGYGQPKQQRLESARKLGFETYQGGLALSGPRYFDYFRQVCFEMIDEYGINQFKFDGTGNTDRVIAGSAFDSDFDAAIALIAELRSRKPDLYVNLTTGTYPSPFWLRYADSIWRGGEDHDFAGVGSARQRWITYRDGQIYLHVVQAGPLFPLSSLMLHGIIYAQHAKDLNSDPNNDFADEVHSYFGTGTQLQEMYVTPALLTAENWDTLAAAAKWSRENAGLLSDTHWIGGDPLQLQAYGWAAWSMNKGIVTLRNPSDHEQSFVLDVDQAFELLPGTAQQFHIRNIWSREQTEQDLVRGQSYSIQMKPFQVLTLAAEAID